MKGSKIELPIDAVDDQGNTLPSKDLIGMMEDVEDCACIGLSCKCGIAHIYTRNLQGERRVIWINGDTLKVGTPDQMKAEYDALS